MDRQKQLGTQRFTKCERLCSKTEIAALFKQRKSTYAFPLRILFDKRDVHQSAKILLSVSKRKIRKASDRNTIKRQLREIYRKFDRKEALAGHHIAILYSTDTPVPFSKLEKSMYKCLERMVKELD